MPLQPNGGKFQMPVETEADVLALFERAKELSQTAGFFTRDRYRADIEDHFYYIGAICPTLFCSISPHNLYTQGKLRLCWRLLKARSCISRRRQIAPAVQCEYMHDQI